MLMQFSLNDYEYHVSDSWALFNLIQVCSMKGVIIPRFCYYSKLSIAGNCRMCLIEEEESPKLVASCAMPLADNMLIYTNSLRVRKSREGVLEFLLANHPLDCPICDQGGECDLQDQSMIFGGDRGRFYDFKRSVENKNCGPLIKTIMNRCIHCTRCVRFATEVAGISVLGLTGRGSSMQIGFYIQKLFSSEISGNVIDLCPVGASTSKPYAFTARPWELRSVFTIDPLDSLCSSIRIDVRGTSIARILPRTNSVLNLDWISDKIRFFYDGLYRQRIASPFVKVSGFFVPLSWRNTFGVLKKILASFRDQLVFTKKSFFFSSVFFGPSESLEVCFSVRNFLQFFSSNQLSQSDDACFSFWPSSRFANIEFADLLYFENLNIRYQSPVLNILFRNSYLKSNTLVVYSGSTPFNNYFYKHAGNEAYARSQMVRGKSWVSSLFQLFEFPLMLSASSLSASKFLNSNLHQFSIWEGRNAYASSVSVLHNQFLNVAKSSTILGENMFSLQYYLNCQPVEFKAPLALSVYHGHHGDRNLELTADVLLPSTTFVETNALFLNICGVVQMANRVFHLDKFRHARSSWKIFRAMLTVMGGCPVWSSFSSLVRSLWYEFPLYVVDYQYSGLWPKISLLSNLPLNHGVFSPYKGDALSKNSKVLSLCHLFLRSNLNVMF
uniref:NADH-ubiquinone oxidoreductase 75 kDa subunit n=1 Tax=Balamuthia mandrillaris TaxID=66527 RepID=A0A0K1HRY7_9EUKA|nr:NADH dehydrogenase subunit 11 [Balamuthia mandrillaris]AKT94909.1 NADH dehydrogenase subunit 11 [Balamuthia mandrillaris]